MPAILQAAVRVAIALGRRVLKRQALRKGAASVAKVAKKLSKEALRKKAIKKARKEKGFGLIQKILSPKPNKEPKTMAQIEKDLVNNTSIWLVVLLVLFMMYFFFASILPNNPLVDRSL